MNVSPEVHECVLLQQFLFSMTGVTSDDDSEPYDILLFVSSEF